MHNPNWTKEKNKEIFGKCNNPNYHGHNYELEVKVIGYIQSETGYVIDTKILSDLIKNKITNRFDHKNLNLEVEAFQHVNPTVENIAIEIYNRLTKRLDKSFAITVKLFETPRNFVFYTE